MLLPLGCSGPVIRQKVGKLLKDLAVGKSGYSTTSEVAKTVEDKWQHSTLIIAFLGGIVAALVCAGKVSQTYAKDKLLCRNGRSFEYDHEETLQFPDVCVCNNVVNSTGYPRNVGCFYFPFSFTEQHPPQCKTPFVKENLTIAKRSCLLYGNQTAQKERLDTMRIVIEVGNESNVEEPYRGAFMILKDPTERLTTTIDDYAAAARWQILSPKTYYLIHLEKEIISMTKASSPIDDDQDQTTRYDAVSAVSAPLAFQGMNKSTVVIDLLYRSFDVVHRHDYPLRNRYQLLAELGGASTRGLVLL